MRIRSIRQVSLTTPFEMPFSGKYNWLYAGEAAAAFIAAVTRDGDGAPVFDLNGACETIERAFEILKTMAPQAQISCSGPQFPFPADFDDGPLRQYLPHYPSVDVAEGVKPGTWRRKTST